MTYEEESRLEFEVLPVHLLLLSKINFRWNDEMYDGSPEVDSKRPYGNKGPLDYDIPMMFGEYKDEFSEEELNKYQKLHEEMLFILQILANNAGIELGLYRRPEYSYNGWRKVII